MTKFGAIVTTAIIQLLDEYNRIHLLLVEHLLHSDLLCPAGSQTAEH